MEVLLLLQSHDNSSIIAKKKHTMSIYQAIRVVLLRAVVFRAAAAATVFVQMTREERNVDLNKHPLC